VRAELRSAATTARPPACRDSGRGSVDGEHTHTAPPSGTSDSPPGVMRFKANNTLHGGRLNTGVDAPAGLHRDVLRAARAEHSVGPVRRLRTPGSWSGIPRAAHRCGRAQGAEKRPGAAAEDEPAAGREPSPQFVDSDVCSRRGLPVVHSSTPQLSPPSDPPQAPRAAPARRPGVAASRGVGESGRPNDVAAH